MVFATLIEWPVFRKKAKLKQANVVAKVEPRTP